MSAVNGSPVLAEALPLQLAEAIASTRELIAKAETPALIRQHEFYGRGRVYQVHRDGLCSFAAQERAGSALTSYANDVERALKARIEQAMRGQAVQA